ncbi:sulfatase family protein [Echinimonas agarilytica]|uniref:Sulfatase n=1 Tax=Echinimonas agarilytica TaxID=1215918 RepID=A0AA41W680_9GAMM|nr:sulfatase [Echinimonas agarilytica]MCM2679334.1 sulfatase [Echinimonas agarilytica]
MSFRQMIFKSSIAALGLSLALISTIAQAKQPNVIIVFTDDQGWEDLSSYGSTTIATPRLDELAQSGIQLNDFYVASSVCSASRAALLTGRAPVNNGVLGVYFPDTKGMKPSEITMAEVLKEAGYATAAIGKWHLGDQKESLPTGQGFDYYYGIPFSNDMFIGHSHSFAEDVTFHQGYDLAKAKADQALVKKAGKKRAFIKKSGIKELVPIFENEQIIEYPAEQASLSKRYVDKAIDFINQSNDSPFFVYLTPSMPHVPLFASPEFKGKSKGGLYGDTVEEIDYHIGRLMDFLEAKDLRDNTILVFASDNGPWLGYGKHAGNAGPFSHGKFTNYEGGIRVPAIISWPTKIKQGQQSSEIVSALDLLPTIAHYAKAELPKRTIDGHNIADYLEGKQSTLEHPNFLHFKNKVAGVRVGDWKYIRSGMAVYGKSGRTPNNEQELLFNLKDDPAEQTNLADRFPERVAELQTMVTTYESSL